MPAVTKNLSNELKDSFPPAHFIYLSLHARCHSERSRYGHENAYKRSWDRIRGNIAIYKARWAIGSLFKQIKQNFPLRYFYGKSANAIKIQVWVTLIANMLITLLQKGVSRPWSFSGLATIVRIMLMYYIDVRGFEHPEKDWEEALVAIMENPPEADETKIIALTHIRAWGLGNFIFVWIHWTTMGSNWLFMFSGQQ